MQIESDQRKIITPVENRLMEIFSIGFVFQFFHHQKEKAFSSKVYPLILNGKEFILICTSFIVYIAEVKLQFGVIRD